VCHFVTLALGSPKELAKLEVIAERHGRKLEPLANRSVEEHLKQGETYFYTTKRMCDCGTTLGYDERRKRKPSADLDPQVKKLRAKGWKQSKIDRWLADKAHHEATQAIVSSSDEHWNDDWFALLTELLDSGLVRHVCLLLHFYSGPLSGRIDIKERIQTNLREAGLGFLLKIQEDVLYEFH
jgi:hypothetical protein